MDGASVPTLIHVKQFLDIKNHLNRICCTSLCIYYVDCNIWARPNYLDSAFATMSATKVALLC